MMKRLGIVFLALFCVFFLSTRARAVATYTVVDEMNMGTYIQTAATASVKLSYAAGTQPTISGVVTGSSTTFRPVRFRFTADPGTYSSESLKFNSVNSVTYSDSNSNCRIAISTWTFSRTKKNNMRKGQTYDVTVGGTAKVTNGFCSAGTHTFYTAMNWGSVINNRTTSHTADFPIHITFEAPLSVEETQGMSFGTFLSPTTTSSIILSPSGSYTTTGNVTFVDNTLIPGEFTVTGIGSRQVSITLPASTTLSNGTQTMTADSFTSTPTGSFTLSGSGTGQTQDVKVGSTLHINSNQRAGNYTGTYPIIVSY